MSDRRSAVHLTALPTWADGHPGEQALSCEWLSGCGEHIGSDHTCVAEIAFGIARAQEEV